MPASNHPFEILSKIDGLPVDAQVKVSLKTLKGEILSYVTAAVATCGGGMAEKDIALAQTESKR